MKLKNIFLYIILAVMAVGSISAQKVYAAPNMVNMNLVYDGVTHKYSAKPVQIKFNGVEVVPTIMPAIILESRTLVPLREVFEAFGAVVDWKDITREAYIGYGENLIILKAGSKTVNLNGTYLEMDVPARIINDKIMVPARFPATSLGFIVDWDEYTRTVLVTGETKDVPQDIVDEDTIPTDIDTDTDTDIDIDTDYTEEISDQQINPPVNTPNVSNSPNPAQDISTKEISAVPYPATDITSIQTPLQTGNDTFIITAKSEISRVEKLLLPDNRLVIDIHNSTLLVENKNITLTDSDNVSSVWAAQNQVTPEKITRVVFALQPSAKFDVSISHDRKNIVVSFSHNIIRGITFETVNGFDIVKVTADTAPVVTTFTLPDPNRVVIDIPFSMLSTSVNDMTVNGLYTTSIRYSQYDASTVRIVLETPQFPNIGTNRSGNTTSIQLAKSTYSNIRYSESERVLVLTKDPSSPININEIAHKDNYNSLNYILTLPGNYSLFYGFGEIPIDGDRIKSIGIQTNNNKTAITLNESQIIAVTISEDDTNIYVKVQLPKEKYKRVVLIDPGHGLNDPGTNGNGLIEKTLNLNIALKILEAFEKDSSIKVYSTRLTDTYPANKDRALMGNQIADLFVSLHHNAPTGSNPVPRGAEVLYFNHSNEDPKGLTSEVMAGIILDNLVDDCGLVKRRLLNSPNIIVLNQTKIPAVLVEFGFVTNPEEAKLLNSEEFKNKAANSVYRSIVQIFDTYKVGR